MRRGVLPDGQERPHRLPSTGPAHAGRLRGNAVDDTFVIVGASHSAAQAVDSLRREGHAGPIVLVGDEPGLPYQRPPLSKKCLAGEMDEGRLWIRPAAF